MKKKLFLIPILIAVMIAQTFLFVGCSAMFRDDPIRWDRVYGDFTFRMAADGVSWIDITGLSPAGQEQRHIVIPTHIQGVRVTRIRSDAMLGMNSPAIFESEVLEKVFMPNRNIGINLRAGYGVKFFVFDVGVAHWESDTWLYDKPSVNSIIYIYRNLYRPEFNYNAWGVFNPIVRPSNTTFRLNYDSESPFNIHWIDEIEHDERIEFVPPMPVREGYRFGGWYMEPETINVWNFDMHTRTGEFIDLFAKWISV